MDVKRKVQNVVFFVIKHMVLQVSLRNHRLLNDGEKKDSDSIAILLLDIKLYLID